MPQIKNKMGLIENADSKVDRKARKAALEALESALEAANPKAIVESRLTVEGKILKIGKRGFDLGKFKNVFVVGGGKASGKMAEALESVLGEKITRGIVNVPNDSEPYKTLRIELHKSSHPIPDEAGVKGTQEMLAIASQAEEDDLIICLISGGGSSLMPLPRGEISLSDKQMVTNELLKSGATIKEINTVRKHISDFKGGWLAQKAYPATIVNLVLSDVIGDPVEFIASGPTVPDSTTFSDSIAVLRRHGLWKKTPQSVKALLDKGQEGLIAETPKPGAKAFRRVFNVIIGNNRLATSAAHKSLQSSGFKSLILSSVLEGEAKQVGTVLASVAEEVMTSGNPLPRPCGIIAGGETTVAVFGKGKGGRNQEIALSAALKIIGKDGVAIASFSTDGTDGPTDAAGALVDGNTIARSSEQRLDARSFLDNNDSYNFFSKLGDLIFTGPTGTNVNDVSVVIIV